ncbi:HBS1-like protein [Nymphon striatum]|nr:HBS1-like protein [Nymphon striatum]
MKNFTAFHRHSSRERFLEGDKSESKKNSPKVDNIKNHEKLLSDYKTRLGGKEQINMVVVGHVDAGKSTLMGHLLFKLGCVNKQLMHKYQKESQKLGKGSFMYAWVLDETGEERSRGVTMDIAQSEFETEHKIITLLDAPGHKDFIPNMITGASQADVAVLVVDATRGEFETGFDSGGQTREHAILVKALGVSQLAVAVNKLDNVEWSEERFNEIKDKLKVYLKQIGYKDSDVKYIPCSGLVGENINEGPVDEKLKAWYKGLTLIQAIDEFSAPERAITKPLRFTVSDVFKGQNGKLCIAGRVETGSIQCVYFDNTELIYRTLAGVTIGDNSVNQAFAGDHVVISVSGIDMNNIFVGNIICDRHDPIKAGSVIRARVILFNPKVPITKGFPVILYTKSVSEQASVSKIISLLNKSTGEIIKKKPRCLSKNSSAEIKIKTSRPICVEAYKDCKELGRITLRYGGSTIAAGLVTKLQGNRVCDPLCSLRDYAQILVPFTIISL